MGNSFQLGINPCLFFRGLFFLGGLVKFGFPLHSFAVGHPFLVFDELILVWLVVCIIFRLCLLVDIILCLFFVGIVAPNGFLLLFLVALKAGVEACMEGMRGGERQEEKEGQEGHESHDCVE